MKAQEVFNAKATDSICTSTSTPVLILVCPNTNQWCCEGLSSEMGVWNLAPAFKVVWQMHIECVFELTYCTEFFIVL